MNLNHEALRAIRGRSGMTVTALAAVTGIDRANLSNMEVGRRSPTPAQIVAIAKALAVPVGAIATADVEVGA